MFSCTNQQCKVGSDWTELVNLGDMGWGLMVVLCSTENEVEFWLCKFSILLEKKRS